MTCCFITNIISPHQMPLARELLIRFGAKNFRYVAEEEDYGERKKLGWTRDVNTAWILEVSASEAARRESEKWMADADVVICGLRDNDFFEKRLRNGRCVIYMSERWFKPPFGMLRLFHPPYLRMSFRFCRLLSAQKFYYLPIGTHAANDMLRMVRLFGLFPRWLFREPLITAKELKSKLFLWGYFVEPSENRKVLLDAQKAKNGERGTNNRSMGGSDVTNARMNPSADGRLKVLWVGRMLNWKRVDTLIKAVGHLHREGRNIQLTLVGHGLEEARLRKLAEQSFAKPRLFGISSCFGLQKESPVTFHPPVPITLIRDFMRQADVYVLPSDGGEGWGAVVNEAMEEGCAVIASYECGSSATMIKDGQNGLLFHAGDVKALAKRLRRMLDEQELCRNMGENGHATIRQLWGPGVAADRLVAFCKAVLAGQPYPRYCEGPLSEALD